MQFVDFLAINLRPQIFANKLNFLLRFDCLVVLIDKLLHHILGEDLSVATSELLSELPAGELLLEDCLGLVAVQVQQIGLRQVDQGRFFDAPGS